MRDCHACGIKLAWNKPKLNQIVNINKEIKRKIVTFVTVKFKFKTWIGIKEDTSNCSRGLKKYIIYFILQNFR